MSIDVHFDLLSAPPFGLSWTQVVYGIPLALIAFLALRIIYSLHFHPLAAYPGPLLARLGVPFLSWAQIQGAKNRTLWSLDEVHDQYGDWVRIGYNELSTLEPAALPVLYSPSTKYLAADVVGSLAFGNDDGFELMKQNDDPQGFLDAVIGTNKGGFIFGSFEAWGSSIFHFLAFVAGTPPGIRRVLNIDEAFDNGSLSWPPTYAEATKLEYFQACLKEALRMWPAVAWILARKAPPGGGVMGDRSFPAGTIVGVSAHHDHRRRTALEHGEWVRGRESR
ncbi:unnamed protein product [Jaminaea pallidilutea]